MDTFRFLFVMYGVTSIFASIGIAAGFSRNRPEAFQSLWFIQKAWFFFQITLMVFALRFGVEYALRSVTGASSDLEGIMVLVSVVLGYFVTKFRCNSLKA
jgi:hypothetical protein